MLVHITINTYISTSLTAVCATYLPCFLNLAVFRQTMPPKKRAGGPLAQPVAKKHAGEPVIEELIVEEPVKKAVVKKERFKVPYQAKGRDKFPLLEKDIEEFKLLLANRVAEQASQIEKKEV